eukprot:1702737-Pleurochrysis_carterae.AAC.2
MCVCLRWRVGVAADARACVRERAQRPRRVLRLAKSRARRRVPSWCAVLLAASHYAWAMHFLYHFHQ